METRTADRLLYAHAGPAAGHLFMGGNHGVTHIFEDGWGDHIHVEVYWEPENVMSFGLWFGLALDEQSGELWTCGKTGCGLEEWDPRSDPWVNGHYRYAFTVFTGDHGLEVPHGYAENIFGTALSPDGTVWFTSPENGVAAFLPSAANQGIRTVDVPSLGSPVDVAADPDGHVWFADSNDLLRYDPESGAATALPLPSGDIRRLYLDGRSQPSALYVSTGAGLYIYRGP